MVPVNRAGVVTVTLQTTCPAGFPIVVTDTSGAANTNNITLQAPSGLTLNGAAGGTATINTAYGAKTIRYNGAGVATAN